MRIIVCLDDNNGMVFNGRRQSQDSVLRDRMIDRYKNLWMNAYTAEQFSKIPESACVDEAFLEKASAEDYCFVENLDVRPYKKKIKALIIYRWNRKYPADLYFPQEILESFTLLESQTFAGSSHDVITEEIYVL